MQHTFLYYNNITAALKCIAPEFARTRRNIYEKQHYF